jgi:hypothetical protein
MPPLEVVKAECWDDEVLWMEGVRAAFGLVYQISSSLGAIAAIICLVCLSQRFWMSEMWDRLSGF